MRRNSKVHRLVAVPGTELYFPETIIYGAKDGGNVTVSAGVHSREYIGIEAVNRLAAELKPEHICGELHLIHALNRSGFISRSPEVFPEDGLNLNRIFPGDPDGSQTQRLAAFLNDSVISRSDAIIDLHSGSFFESLIPHVYFHGAAEPSVCAASQALARRCDVPYIVKSIEKKSFYSWAGQRGVPAIILERGGCGLWSEKETLEDIYDVKNMLRYLGILADETAPAEFEARCFEDACYENAPCSGCWYPAVSAGDRVRQGEVLGEIRDFFGNTLFVSRAEGAGAVLYLAASLAIEKGSPMISYGLSGDKE